MLSGTPWRTKGTIALLDGERNIYGPPVLPRQMASNLTTLINTKNDLESETRGTVVVHFEFVEAEADRQKDSGEFYTLPLGNG
jgi:hypothetical protein